MTVRIPNPDMGRMLGQRIHENGVPGLLQIHFNMDYNLPTSAQLKSRGLGPLRKIWTKRSTVIYQRWCQLYTMKCQKNLEKQIKMSSTNPPTKYKSISTQRTPQMNFA